MPPLHTLPLVDDAHDCDGVTYDGTPVDDSPAPSPGVDASGAGPVEAAARRAGVEWDAVGRCWLHADAGLGRCLAVWDGLHDDGKVGWWAWSFAWGDDPLEDGRPFESALDALLALPPAPAADDLAARDRIAAVLTCDNIEDWRPDASRDLAPERVSLPPKADVGVVRRHVLHARSLETLDRRGMLAMLEEFQRLHPEQASAAYERAKAGGR